MAAAPPCYGGLSMPRRTCCAGGTPVELDWCSLAGNNDLISQRDNKERNALARLVIYNLKGFNPRQWCRLLVEKNAINSFMNEILR